MSYSKQYGPSRNNKQVTRKRKYRLSFLFMFIVALTVLHLIFPAQTQKLKEHAFPFLAPEVQESLSEMAQSIRNGKDFQEAAAVFCKEIINGSQE